MRRAVVMGSWTEEWAVLMVAAMAVLMVVAWAVLTVAVWAEEGTRVVWRGVQGM